MEFLTMRAGDAREAVAGFDLETLYKARPLEVAGRNRKTVLAEIDEAIAGLSKADLAESARADERFHSATSGHVPKPAPAPTPAGGSECSATTRAS